MSNWRLVRLKFGANIAHFGELGIGIEETSERVRSDTLFSAWLSTYAKLFGKDEATTFIDEFKAQPKFHLSSTFVWQQINGKTVDYLPCPLKRPLNYPAGEDDLAFAKTYKGLKYLPLNVWRRWYQEDGFTGEDREQLIARTQKNKRGYEGKALDRAGVFDYSKLRQFYKLPKLAVDRITRATNLYHTGIVQFNNNSETGESLAGLYFLVQFPALDAELENTFFAVLDFLGGEGLGGERSSGAGQFKVDRDATKPFEENFKLTEEWNKAIECSGANAHSLMSLFWTEDDTHLSNLLSTSPQASYGLQERGGWIASPCSDGRQMRRQAVQMFAEGSVFLERPEGKLADVTPTGFSDHQVYRSGIALSLPIKVQESS